MVNKQFHSLIVGVESLSDALAFWQETLGFTIIEQQTGEDHDLSTMLELATDGITAQAILGVDDQQTSSLLHLIEFKDPVKAVRHDASPTDLCPKNIDLYSKDLDAHYPLLESAGYPFRSPWQLLEVDDPSGLKQVKEGQLPGHDVTNIGIMELVNMPLTFTKRGFSGMGPLVTVISDADKEQDFYTNHLGLELCMTHQFSGPEIEKIVGLPPGKALDMRLLGDANSWFGRVELIEYQGISGENLYTKAQAPATGALHLVFKTDDFAESVNRLNTYDGMGETLSISSGIYEGKILPVTTPAGFKVFING